VVGIVSLEGKISFVANVIGGGISGAAAVCPLDSSARTAQIAQ
jgi:hypothetical protein